MLTVKVSDFGPIAAGEVRLRPLTVFVGPNNAGKSYLSMLVYALFGSSFQGPPAFDYRNIRRRYRRAGVVVRRVGMGIPVDRDEDGEEGEAQRMLESFATWVDDRQKSPDGRIHCVLGDLPDAVRDVFVGAVEGANRDFMTAAGRQLQRCFGTDMAELTRRRPRTGGLEISLAQEEPPWTLTLSGERSGLRTANSRFDLSNQPLQIEPLPSSPSRRRRALRSGDAAESMDELMNEVINGFYEGLSKPAFYLPAARSGILQSHKALASFLVRRSPLVGLEPWTDIPRLSGVVADFISNLLTLERDLRTDIYPLTKFLEKDIIHGDVTLESESEGSEYPEIYYTSAAGKFPLHRTSSMVSELAPVILFLRYVV
ncbi:MAG: hypothetical protein ACE5JL_15555, partial [Dehalococcoidia bacterium]